MRQLEVAVSHCHTLIGELRVDPKLAREYLAAAIENDDPRVLLSALRTVVEEINGSKINGSELLKP